MGEGGACAARTAALKTLVESFRDWGRDCWCDPGRGQHLRQALRLAARRRCPRGYDHKYIYSHLGYNLKLTDMQAAVGRRAAAKLDGFVAARRRNFDGCARAGGPRGRVRAARGRRPARDPSWFGFPLAVRRDAPFDARELSRHLDERKIATRLLFAGNLRAPAGLRGGRTTASSARWIRPTSSPTGVLGRRVPGAVGRGARLRARGAARRRRRRGLTRQERVGDSGPGGSRGRGSSARSARRHRRVEVDRIGRPEGRRGALPQALEVAVQPVARATPGRRAAVSDQRPSNSSRRAAHAGRLGHDRADDGTRSATGLRRPPIHALADGAHLEP